MDVPDGLEVLNVLDLLDVQEVPASSVDRVSWAGLARLPTTSRRAAPSDVGGRAKPDHDTGR